MVDRETTAGRAIPDLRLTWHGAHGSCTGGGQVHDSAALWEPWVV